ncbi:MAG: N-acetylmuramoyl-L-alanine amidase [Oscillospiraceae bacterium]|jgi:N-acetylmuramoyl-L-alanine amidase|nr:N-acetylmuramoyl-L-alanine amidase [Oscillospiraceae bacterium]
MVIKVVRLGKRIRPPRIKIVKAGGAQTTANRQITKSASVLLGVALVILSFVLGMDVIQDRADIAAVQAAAVAGSPPILLDAGHGGEDGGTVAVDGTAEKGINLAIAKKLENYLRAFGYQVTMTRENDTATYTPGTKTLRAKKTSDLHNRMAMMDALGPNAIFVSIHQNHYPAESLHGCQVFYSRNTENSKTLAQRIQNSVVSQIQQTNKRLVKPAGTEIYLLYEAKIPAVMVECGFLSNWEETGLLKSDGYQNQIAYAIACGILDYTSGTTKEQAPVPAELP